MVYHLGILSTQDFETKQISQAIYLDVSHPTENLNSLVRTKVRGLRCTKFGHGGRFSKWKALVLKIHTKINRAILLHIYTTAV